MENVIKQITKLDVHKILEVRLVIGMDINVY